MKRKKTPDATPSTLKIIAEGIRKQHAIPNVDWDGGIIGDKLATLLDGSCKITAYKILLQNLIAAIQIDSQFRERFSGKLDMEDIVRLYEFFEALNKIPDVHSYFHLLAIEKEESLSEKDKRYLIQKYYHHITASQPQAEVKDLPF